MGTLFVFSSQEKNLEHSLEKQGKTAMLTAVDGTYAGLVAVVDTIKETSTAAIKRMKDMGLEVIMIIEDNKQTASATKGVDHSNTEQHTQ